VQANVGIAMGHTGTEAAMEAADIVLMQDKLEKIARTRAISKKAFQTIKENILVGVGVVHVTGIVLVLLKVIGPVEAAMIHLVPDTLVFLNSIKLLKIKIR
jgi:Cd2+/Zn2+-exporting ATPase